MLNFGKINTNYSIIISILINEKIELKYNSKYKIYLNRKNLSKIQSFLIIFLI
jgi:hypothetical protein